MNRAKQHLVLLLFAIAIGPAWSAENSGTVSAPDKATGAKPATNVQPDVGGNIQNSAAMPTLRGPQMLRETVVKQSSAQDNSVETFFEINSNQKSNNARMLLQPEMVSALDRKPSAPRKFPRWLWHTLDNCGFPMFFDQDNACIDPGIRETYLIPSPILPSEKEVARQVEKASKQVISQSGQGTQSASDSRETDSTGGLHKIPVTELEGVPLPTPSAETNVPKL